jgi:hypothetical protein
MSGFLLTKDQKAKRISRVRDYFLPVQECESLALFT